MAWDTEKTRRRLLEAAVLEFSEYGLAGARVDRIAKSAGINKERIYQYFGNKEGLFRAVLEQEMTKLAAAVPLTAEQADDLGEYAGCVFDYHYDNPHFLRLMRWEGLTVNSENAVAAAERTAHQKEKVDAVAAAQRRGTVTSALPAGQVLYGVTALAAWWFTAPHIVQMAVGDDTVDRAAQRAVIVELARRMTAP